MEIIEAARQLGKAIQSDERYIKYNECRKKNDEDEALQSLIGEINLVRMQIETENAKDDKDEEKIKELSKKWRQIYSEIMVNENMQAYNRAKNDVDTVLQRMNSILDQCVEGEDPDTCEPASGCTGNCGSCGGCH